MAIDESRQFCLPTSGLNAAVTRNYESVPRLSKNLFAARAVNYHLENVLSSEHEDGNELYESVANRHNRMQVSTVSFQCIKKQGRSLLSTEMNCAHLAYSRSCVIIRFTGVQFISTDELYSHHRSILLIGSYVHGG